MMKKILLIMLFVNSIIVLGQVGINTAEPNSNTLLHISEKTKSTDPATNDKLKGIIIPRLTESEREKLTYVDPSANPKVIKLSAADNSLMIFNTTEDCYNFWNQAEGEWKSLCGQLGKSQISFNCSDIQVRGTYVVGRELTASNFLSIPVTVTKAGDYTILATTTNGYSFFVTGTFLNTGTYTVQVPGQGTPTAIGTDVISMNSNGVDVACTPALTVNVLSAAGTYTMSCGTATANGVYKVGTALTSTNTITLPVVVTNLGSYSITTNTVNGFSFSGSGTFTSIGNQTITLYGTGKPTSTSLTQFTITSDSQGDVSTTCNVNVNIVVPKKRILTLGAGIYNAGNSGATYYLNKMLTSLNNFGTNLDSTVKFDGWEIIDGPDNPTAGQLTTWLTGADPVDIVISGHGGYIGSGTKAPIVADYLAKKGIVVVFNEFVAEMQPLFRAVFGDLDITATQAGAGGAGTVKQFGIGLINDPVINGPFGNLAGKYWGEDCSETLRVNNLPLNEVTVYSNGVYNNTSGSAANITSFRHNTLSLVWVGDGGFVSNNNSTASGAGCYPFLTDSNNRPIPRPNYGSTNTTIYNSVFVANALAWAINKAQTDGINTK